jgi:hypothetical protein
VRYDDHMKDLLQEWRIHVFSFKIVKTTKFEEFMQMYMNCAFKDAKFDWFNFFVLVFQRGLLNRIVRNLHTKSYLSKAIFEPNLSILLTEIKSGKC